MNDVKHTCGYRGYRHWFFKPGCAGCDERRRVEDAELSLTTDAQEDYISKHRPSLDEYENVPARRGRDETILSGGEVDIWTRQKTWK